MVYTLDSGDEGVCARGWRSPECIGVCSAVSSVNSSFIVDLYMPVEPSLSPSLAGRGQTKEHIQRTFSHRRCREGVCRPEPLSASSSVGAHGTDASNSATMTTTITTTAMAAVAPERCDEVEGLFAEVMSKAVGLEVVVVFVNAAVGMEVGKDVGITEGLAVGMAVGLIVGMEVGLVVGVAVGAKVKLTLEVRHAGVTDPAAV